MGPLTRPVLLATSSDLPETCGCWRGALGFWEDEEAGKGRKESQPCQGEFTQTGEYLLPAGLGGQAALCPSQLPSSSPDTSSNSEDTN